MIYFFAICVDEFELYFIPKIARLASPKGYNTLKGPTSQGLHFHSPSPAHPNENNFLTTS